MTHSEAFDILEKILDKYLPVDRSTNNTKIRAAIRSATLICAWPDQYTIDKAMEQLEIEKEPS